MNKILPSAGRSFLLITGLFLFSSFLFGDISAQVYFIATEVATIPENPDDQTPTSIRISGFRRDVCSFLGASSLNINASFTVLNMDWDNQADTDPDAVCPNLVIPWDTTFQLGILNGGTNAFYFSGNNYALNGLSNPTIIQVAAADCNNGSTEIVVTNTNDEGPGSLRQAIVCANAQSGFNRIVFNLTGDGPDTIRVGETSGFELPSIFDDSTFIDATTHPAYGSDGDFSPKVVLDGQFHDWEAAINALFVRADRCGIYGLEIINFPDDAIDVLGGDDVEIGGINRGNVIHNNGLEQDFFAGNPGQGPWEGCGIVIRGGSARATIRGNFIGTNYFETTPNGNEFCGILIRDGGDLHRIGGRLDGMGNVIANNASGIIIGGGSDGCRILQNSMYCNDTLALQISSASNEGVLPPTISLAEKGSISGTAAPNQAIALYRNDNTDCTAAPCQGGTYLGTVNVGDGTWSLSEPFVDDLTLNTGDVITAIATDLTGNSSEFAECATYTACSLILTVDDLEATTCGENNGTASLSVSGGVGPFVFSYNGQNSNSPNLTSLSPGDYTVTVTDGDNCSTENSFAITENTPPVLSIATQNNATCNNANGNFTLSVANGQPPFVYSVNETSSGSPVFENFLAGTYEVFVTDNDGCTDVVTIVLTDSDPPIIAISELNMATCGASNGSLVVVAGGGVAPFVYSIDGTAQNNGNFDNLAGGIYAIGIRDANDCTAQINAVIGDTPPVVVAIDRVDNPACGNEDGQFTIAVSGGTAPFNYTLNGSPVNETTFADLAVGDYVVVAMDANSCSGTIEVELVNVGMDPVSSFNFELADQQITAQSTATGATSLTWDFGDGNGSTEANITYEYDASGIYDLCLTATNECGSVTTCQTVEILLPLNDFTIAGEIFRPDGSGIAQVTVNRTGPDNLENNEDGTYLFENVPQGEDYIITPVKDINYRNGVSVLDIINIRRHLLFIDTFDTPYQYLAADINRNGSVSVFDLLQVQQLILEVTEEFPQHNSWEFLPADVTFDYASQALQYNYAQSITVNNLESDVTGIDFIGVKIGDINGNNDPSRTSNVYTNWQITDQVVTAGEIVEIRVRVSEAQKMLGFEAALNFDPQQLELLEVAGVTDYRESDGLLKVLWYTEDDQSKAKHFAPETDFITLQFLANNSLEKISDIINFTTPDSRQVSYDAQGTEQNINWTFTDAVVTNTKNFGESGVPEIYPNPFSREVSFAFELSTSSVVSLELYDVTGKIVFRKEEALTTGLQTTVVSENQFPATGTYFYLLKIEDKTFRGRIIKQ